MRKAILGLAAVAGLLALTWASGVWSGGWGSFFGLAFREATTDPNAAHVVAKVGSETVTVGSIKTAMAMLHVAAIQSGHKPDSVTKAMAFEQAKTTAVLMNEAKKRGITVSEEEGRQMADEQRANIALLPPGDRSELVTAIRGMGFTEEQFWTEYAPRAYAHLAYLGRLRQQVQDATPGDSVAKRTGYQQFVQSLMASTRVDILDDSWTR